MADSSYAIIKSGDKQYRVVTGSRVMLDKLTGNPGDLISFGEVLAVQSGDGDSSAMLIGAPTVSGVSVKGKILAHRKDKKIIIFKKKRRKGYTKYQGHRQERTEVLIEAIQLSA